MKQTFLIGTLFGSALGFWLAAQVRVLNFPVLHFPKRINIDISNIINVDALFVVGFFLMLWVVSRSRRHTTIRRGRA